MPQWKYNRYRITLIISKSIFYQQHLNILICRDLCVEEICSTLCICIHHLALLYGYILAFASHDRIFNNVIYVYINVTAPESELICAILYRGIRYELALNSSR